MKEEGSKMKVVLRMLRITWQTKTETIRGENEGIREMD